MSLPVRALTLYKHGIAVVERGGPVEGEEVQLAFHRDQMNDVLKSLVAWDRAGGQVRAVAYDAPEERERKLARGSIHLGERSALLDLLRDLRGRAARVTAGEGTLEGTVVGLQAEGEHALLRGRLALLVEGTLRVLPLRDIVAVEPLEPAARADLAFFLRLSTAEPEQRTVTLRLSPGAHDLALRYVVPSPTWRVSYRLVGNSETGEAYLQGWGIFDNPFDEPLEAVAIRLVSGQPISFIYDLYTPYLPERPEIKEERRVTRGPVEMERATHSKRARRPAAYAMEAALSAPAPLMEDALRDSTPIAAEGSAQDDLFEYAIRHPVTVARGEAAMVPIVGEGLPYRKEHIYNGHKVPTHPTVVLRFTNATPLTLERGPITVLEDDRYLGEAIFPFSRPQAEVLLPIAVELGVRVREEQQTRQETFRVSVERHFLVMHQYTTLETAYEISNSNPRPISLLLEHPRRHGFEPFEMAAPEESTDEQHRWRVDVPAGPTGQSLFIVQERRVDRTQQAIRDLSSDALRRYLASGWLDKALGNGLREILRLQAEQQRAARRIQELDKAQQRAVNSQEQARKNMSGLRDSGDEGALRARYVRQLNESEDRLATLDAERARLQAETERLEAQLSEAIRALG